METAEARTEILLGTEAVVASPVMRTLFKRVEKIAQSDCAVLIQGETGTGKEIVARAVHCYSPRSQKPWVDLNCGALPENLMESELFGYERGAFSGAMSSKAGLLELASGGTLFLDEVGELPLHLQVKLLRVLDGAPYFRIGGLRKVLVNVRIVAATNRNLLDLVQARLFREDLYYRLRQMAISVPPLRERAEDLGPLAQVFADRVRKGLVLTGEALRKLESWHWPGNIRELRNLITDAAIFAEGDEITAADLRLEGAESSGIEARDAEPRSLETLEKETILRMLRTTDGHQQRAADALGISRRTLTRRLKQYGRR